MKENENAVEADSFLMTIEDFDIVELEDRLELAMRCNNNCSCGTKPT